MTVARTVQSPTLTTDDYFLSAYQKYENKDYQGALADYNRAIAINPDDADAYYNRGILKESKLNDPRGALADFNRAITINPDYANAYYNRGILQERLDDPQGALADLNKALQINPQLANAYAGRGLVKAKQLNDHPGGIADLRQAARLARAQRQTGLLQTVLWILNQLGAAE